MIHAGKTSRTFSNEKSGQKTSFANWKRREKPSAASLTTEWMTTHARLRTFSTGSFPSRLSPFAPVENDHFFPYSKLKTRGYGQENRLKYSLAQELTNRAILTQIGNRTKGAMDAQVYLADVKARFPDSLALQCIPEDRELWEIENYEAFLQARRSALAFHLNAFLTGITDTKPPEAAVTLEELIAEGEDDEPEFKSSLRWDIKEHVANKKLEEVIVKTVAAFANSQGGTLLIGVSDAGEVLGLEGDYLSLGGANRDKFELHLRNLLNSSFGTAFVSSKPKILFPSIRDVEICQIDIQPATKPLILAVKDRNGVQQ